MNATDHITALCGYAASLSTDDFPVKIVEVPAAVWDADADRPAAQRLLPDADRVLGWTPPKRTAPTGCAIMVCADRLDYAFAQFDDDPELLAVMHRILNVLGHSVVDQLRANDSVAIPFDELFRRAEDVAAEILGTDAEGESWYQFFTEFRLSLLDSELNRA